MNDNKFVKGEWEHAIDFHDEDSGMVLRVRELTGVYKPIYSYELGRANADKKFSRHFAVQLEIVNGIVSIRSNSVDFKAMDKLVQQANQWVLDSRQVREDEIMQEKRDREESQIEREKPRIKPGLKTLSRQDALKKSS